MSNDQDHDRFADALDRIVSGQQPEEDPLASFAREIHMHQGLARLDPDRRAEIRSGLMQNITSTTPTPTTGGAGPLSQPTIIDPAAHNPWVRRKPANNRTPAGWRSHVVRAQTAIVIVTALALLTVGIAWYTGQEGSGPERSSNQIAAPTEVVSRSQGSGAVEPLRVNDSGQTPPVTYSETTNARDGRPTFATPEASPAATPVTNARDGDQIAMDPIDDSIWLACPDDTGPYTLAARSEDAGDNDSGTIQTRITPWSGPAVPPTIPCDYPKPEPPPDFEPVPLD